jgi:hypothetical protein
MSSEFTKAEKDYLLKLLEKELRISDIRSPMHKFIKNTIEKLKGV